MIEVDGVTLKRGNNTVLDGYSFNVEPGSILAVLGANGVGKTTLLNTIVGLLNPDSGTVRIDGRIGYVPQLFFAAFDYSVLDMVLMGRAKHIGVFGSPSGHDYEVAEKYLDFMRVLDLKERGFNTLSGGQRQLVMIAQALASECNILILDEPCSALDYSNQAIVISMLDELNRTHGQTIIFTTHAPQHGLEAASDVLLMRDSRTYRHGPTGDILTAENLTELYGIEIERADFVISGDFTLAPRFRPAGKRAASP